MLAISYHIFTGMSIAIFVFIHKICFLFLLLLAYITFLHNVLVYKDFYLKIFLGY